MPLLEELEPDARPSLPEVFASVRLSSAPGFWRRLLGFIGPGFLISVGYMDPGNWATDLAGGSRYGYTLLFVIMLSNLLAILLQSLALKLGIATGRDLAQACRETYPQPVNVALWIFAEIAIAACDLAEVIGSAIGLQFHLPLLLGVVLTGGDVLLILLLQRRGFRYLEAVVMVLIGTIALLFGVEVVLSRPEWVPVLANLVMPPRGIVTDPKMLYIAIGILGATVMPHNLYLHSSIVQTRAYERTIAGKREAIRFANIDSATALMLALFVNAAILVVAATVIVTAIYGSRGTANLLLLSQVILSLQLSFAVFPLVSFTSDRARMGPFVNRAGLRYLGYGAAGLIAAANLWFLLQMVLGHGIAS